MGAQQQIDLFGTAHLIKPKVVNRKFATMQEMYGTSEGNICRDCVNCVKMNHGRTVYKCVRWKFTSSAISDIDAMQSACCKFLSY